MELVMRGHQMDEYYIFIASPSEVEAEHASIRAFSTTLTGPRPEHGASVFRSLIGKTSKINNLGIAKAAGWIEITARSFE